MSQPVNVEKLRTALQYRQVYPHASLRREVGLGVRKIARLRRLKQYVEPDPW